MKITKSKRTETYGYKLQINFETVCFCTLAPASPEYTNRHLESAAKNHFRFLWSIFKASRAVFFDILSGLKFLSTSEDAAIERAIEFAKIHRNRRVDLIPLSPEKESKETQLSTMEELSWIPDNWWNFVTDQKRRQQIPSNINRRNFELCLFSQIVLALKSTDIYVENSGQYSDYRSRLVLWDEFDSNIVHYGEMVGLPVEKKCFINYIKELLFKKAEDTDSTYTENQEFNIDENEPQSLLTEELDKIVLEIVAQMPLFKDRAEELNRRGIYKPTRKGLQPWTADKKQRSHQT